MSPMNVARPLNPAPFVGDVPRMPSPPNSLTPVNNIAPFRPTPYNAPAPPAIAVPAAAAATGSALSGSAVGLYIAIPAVVIGGIVGGSALPVSPGTVPPDPIRFPFPKPSGGRNKGSEPQPDQGQVGAVYYVTSTFSRSISPVTVTPNTYILGRYSSMQRVTRLDYVQFGVYQNIGSAQGRDFKVLAEVPANEVEYWSGRILDVKLTQAAPAPAAPPAPAIPKPRPDAPRPDRPTLPPGVKPDNVPVPFRRPGPKTAPPEPSPTAPPVEPKPFNVPKPFTRPPRPGQPSPDRRVPPPNSPQNPPQPKTDPATPGQPSPGQPKTDPAPKTPKTPQTDRPRLPGPIPAPIPQPLPPFTPQTSPPTLPTPDFTPFPVPDPLPSPHPRIDPSPTPSPNPNPRPDSIPLPFPTPNPPPQTDKSPQPDPSPTPNPNPRRVPPPPLPPQIDKDPKRNEDKTPNPNPPYFPQNPPPQNPPPQNPPPQNPPPQNPPPQNPPPQNPPPQNPPIVCPPCPPCPDPCKVIPSVSITYKKFVGCLTVLGVPAYFVPQSVMVPAPDAAAMKLTLDNQADILALQCKDKDCVAAVPDWWQVRLGADRPQLIVQYAQKFSDGSWDKPKYVVSIPKWSKSQEDTKDGDFPIYQKGQYQGTTIFSDNSKLIVNCITASEAERVTSALLLSITDINKAGSVYSSTSRLGRSLAEITVYPRSVKFFATGQKNLVPTWSKNL